jgi:hypothetical protein
VIAFPAGRPDGIAAARGDLARELPEFALIVTKPDHLDVNLHFALLETLAALDADPFVDVAFGYVTGATLPEAKAFVERILALEAKKEPLPAEVRRRRPDRAGPRPVRRPAGRSARARLEALVRLSRTGRRDDREEGAARRRRHRPTRAATASRAASTRGCRAPTCAARRSTSKARSTSAALLLRRHLELVSPTQVGAMAASSGAS